MAKQAKLTEGPIKKTLIHLTLPMMVGMIGMMIFNIADTFFIGKLGTLHLAAISYTFPVVLVVGSFSMGVSMGITSAVSYAIGEGNHQKVQRFTTDGILLSLLLVGVISIVGYFTINPLFHLLGATNNVMPYIEDYMQIWYIGIITVIVPMVGNSAIRATGDTKTPAKIMLVSVIVNIILDPLFIFGFGPIPQMNLTGAALATVISRSITLVVAFWVLYKKEQLISFTLPTLEQVWISWKTIMHIGIPAIATGLIFPLSTGIIIRMIANFGNASIAAFGIISRIESFSLLTLMALSSVLGPFVGQNIGATNIKRAKLGIKYSHYFSITWGIVMAILLGIIGGYLGRYFDSSVQVIQIVTMYFLIRPISYGFQGLFRQSTTVFNVLKKPMKSSLLTIFQMFGLYVPLSYLGSEWFGLYGIFYGITFSYIISGITSAIFLNYSMVKIEKQ